MKDEKDAGDRRGGGDEREAQEEGRAPSGSRESERKYRFDDWAII